MNSRFDFFEVKSCATLPFWNVSFAVLKSIMFSSKVIFSVFCEFFGMKVK